MQEENNGALNNDDIINNNKPHLLEILACDETLEDFEKYLLERGFNEMLSCITSDNTNEKQQFDKFFEYFKISMSVRKTDNATIKQNFIKNLQQYLCDIKKQRTANGKKTTISCHHCSCLTKLQIKRIHFGKVHNFNIFWKKFSIIIITSTIFFKICAKL